MTYLWVEKYRPKKVSEVVGNQEAIETFVKWMRSWELGKPEKKAAFLYGPAGIGKTSLVLAYAKEYGYDIVEVNASDWRNEEKMKAIVGESSLNATLDGSTKKIILVDEVDGIAGREDAGGIAALRKIITTTRVPIVLVANNPWDQKLAPIRDQALMIEFKRLSKTVVYKRLKEICEKEGVKIPDNVLMKLAEKSEGDLRSAINDLQALAGSRETVTEKDVDILGERNRVKEIFEALRMVFYAKSIRSARAALEGLELDPDTIYTWILDNVPNQVIDPEDLAEVYEILARADVFFTRMNRYQMWKLMKYAVPLMTGSIVAGRKTPPKGFQKFTFPPKIRLLQQYKNEREIRQNIALKMASKLHLSTYKASKEVLPYMAVILSHVDGRGSKLAKFFELTEEEIEYLAKNYGPAMKKESVVEVEGVKKSVKKTSKRT
ncbi:MAG: replication factor C large subunit [Nitrososphaerota archaeon]